MFFSQNRNVQRPGFVGGHSSYYLQSITKHSVLPHMLPEKLELTAVGRCRLLLFGKVPLG